MVRATHAYNWRLRTAAKQIRKAPHRMANPRVNFAGKNEAFLSQESLCEGARFGEILKHTSRFASLQKRGCGFGHI